MSEETAKPVPRAERVTHYPNEDDYRVFPLLGAPFIISERALADMGREGDPIGHTGVLIREAKLREALQASEAARLAGEQKLAEVQRQSGVEYLNRGVIEDDLRLQIHFILKEGNRVAAALGLPEGAGVDEVLAAIGSLKSCNSDGWDRVQRNEESIRVALSLTHEDMRNVEWWSVIYDRRMFRKQVREILGTGETQEDRWVFEKIHHLKQSDIICREALQQIENLGKFIGHPGATPAHVVSETVSLVEKFMQVAEAIGIIGENPCKASETIFARLRDAGRPESLYHLQKKRADREANHAQQWKWCSESWEQRALAAEAKLAGGPDEKPKPEDWPGHAEGVELTRRMFGGGKLTPTSTVVVDTRPVHEANELCALRKFRRVVCRMHGIPTSAAQNDVYAAIAEYLDCAEKWRQAARGHHPEDLPPGPFSGD